MRRIAPSLALLALAGCEGVAGLDQYCALEPTSPTGATCRLANAQCGCDEGLACTLESADGARTCAPAGAIPIGAPCAVSRDTCEAGAFCLPMNADGAGLCLAYCGDDDDCDVMGSGSYCVPVEGTFTGLCQKPCTPDERVNDCGPGVSCEAATLLGVCYVTGTRQAGETCGESATGELFDTVCGVDLVCLRNTEGVQACFRQCDPLAPSCPDPLGCVLIEGGSDAWGVCSL